MMFTENSKLADWAAPLLDFFFPPLCVGCGEYYDGSSGICERCFLSIEKYEYPICLYCLEMISSGVKCPSCSGQTVPLFSFADYNATMREIIIHLKFKNITTSLDTFARLINEKFGPKIEKLKAQILIPIPLHPGREHKRGYNQALLLAETLSEHLKIDVNHSIIARKHSGRPQAKLKFKQRRDNIKNAFEVIQPCIDATPIMIVDDVVTSGSTMREAANVLTNAGYKVVGAISIAHGN